MEEEVLQSVSDLPVQNPPGEEFSAADLIWVKYASSEHRRDDVALIPYDRMEAFISGESNNPECTTHFHIERGRKRESGSLREYRSDEYLLYRMAQWVKEKQRGAGKKASTKKLHVVDRGTKH